MIDHGLAFGIWFLFFISDTSGCGMCHGSPRRMFFSSYPETNTLYVRLGTRLFSIFIVDCSAMIIIIPPLELQLAAVLPLITFLFWLWRLLLPLHNCIVVAEIVIRIFICTIINSFQSHKKEPKKQYQPPPKPDPKCIVFVQWQRIFLREAATPNQNNEI